MRPASLPAALLAFAALVVFVAPAIAQPTEADRAKEWFVEHDRNHDGYVTLDEVMGYEAKRFRRMDSEGTGRVREDQFCGGIPSTNIAEINRCHARFAKVDADGDAYVTLDEIQEYDRALLQSADQDQDGKVSEAEFMAAFGNGGL
jgi:Ca2+-binding EF-hand superfamily protein